METNNTVKFTVENAMIIAFLGGILGALPSLSACYSEKYELVLAGFEGNRRLGNAAQREVFEANGWKLGYAERHLKAAPNGGTYNRAWVFEGTPTQEQWISLYSQLILVRS